MLFAKCSTRQTQCFVEHLLFPTTFVVAILLSNSLLCYRQIRTQDSTCGYHPFAFGGVVGGRKLSQAHLKRPLSQNRCGLGGSSKLCLAAMPIGVFLNPPKPGWARGGGRWGTPGTVPPWQLNNT